MINIPSHYFPQELLNELKNNSFPDDFTFYLESDMNEALSVFIEKIGLNRQLLTANTIEHETGSGTSASKSKFRFDPLRFTINLCGRKVTGRALICLSYGDRLWSITFRFSDSKEKLLPPLEGQKYSKRRWGKRLKNKEGSLTWDTGFTPKSDRGSNLNSIRELCEVLNEKLFTAQSKSSGQNKETNQGEFQGLIVITGATASAKSQIARGLIDIYLRRSVEFSARDYPRVIKRRPHLVTFEDPIEKYFVELGEPEKSETGERKIKFNSEPKGISSVKPVYIPAHDYNIDYTPREKGKGVETLKQALEDALRQTPKIFFVGETREGSDWQKLLSFAGSGHLVITTAHAGSLIEAMQLIFKSMNVRSASERNHIASRVLGIIHMKRLNAGTIDVLLPAMWRRTPKAINNLTAIGLASLLPGSDNTTATDRSLDGEALGVIDSVKDDNLSSLGRKYFVQRLLKIAERSGDINNLTDELRNELLRKAIEIDLNGE